MVYFSVFNQLSSKLAVLDFVIAVLFEGKSLD